MKFRRSMWKPVFLFGLLLTGLFTPQKPSAAQTPFALDGQIAWLGEDGNLFLQQAAQPPVQVTQSGQAATPTFSADGRWLAYLDGGGLFSLDTTSGNASVEKLSAQAVNPAWSPAEEKLAWLSDGALYVSARAPFEPQKVAGPVESFAWSPDGAEIAYNAPRDGFCTEPGSSPGGSFSILDLSSGQTRQPMEIKPNAFQTARAWLPNDQYLLIDNCGCFSECGQALFSLPTKSIVDAPRVESWTADGETMFGWELFDTNAADTQLFEMSIYSMNVVQVYIKSGWVSWRAKVSPDGRMIAFESGESSGEMFIDPIPRSSAPYLFAIENRELIQISQSELHPLQWSPGSRQVLLASWGAAQGGGSAAQGEFFVYDVDSRAISTLGRTASYRAYAWGPAFSAAASNAPVLKQIIGDLSMRPAELGGSAELTWSAPKINGGDAPRYELRMSREPLTAENISRAAALPIEMTSSPGGSEQKALVKTLPTNLHYFALLVQNANQEWAGLSNILGFQDTGFRPKPNGYAFENYGARDITLDHARTLFGDQMVCANGQGEKCEPSFGVQEWLELSNNASEIGHCAGMTWSSSLLFEGVENASDWQPGANDTYDLKKNTRAVTERIALYHTALNRVTEVQTQVVENSSHGMRSVLDAIGGSMRPVGLAFHYNCVAGLCVDRLMGHMVLPYAMRDNLDGTAQLWIYDNVNPVKEGLFSDNREQIMTVDLNANRWEYKNLSGNAQDTLLYIIPDRLQTPYACPWCGDHSLNVVFASAEGLLTDAAGRVSGIWDGKLVNQIPGAQVLPALDQEQAGGQFTIIAPGGADSQLRVQGLADQTADVAVMYNGQVTRISGWDASQNGTVEMAANGRSFAVSAGGSALSLNMALDTPTGESLSLRVADANVFNGRPLRLTIAQDGQRVTLDGARSQNLWLGRVDADGKRLYQSGRLENPADGVYVIDVLRDGADFKLGLDKDRDGQPDEDLTLKRGAGGGVFSTGGIPAWLIILPGLCGLGLLVGGGIAFWLLRREPKAVKPRAGAPRTTRPDARGLDKMLRQGIELARAGDYTAAKQNLVRLVKLDTQDPDAWIWLGWTAARLGERELAENCLKKARALGHPQAQKGLDWLKQR